MSFHLVNQQELQGFILETFSVNNTKTNYYKDQSVDPLLIYEAYLTSSAPSILLKIVGASSGVKTITLCEVEVYAGKCGSEVKLVVRTTACRV